MAELALSGPSSAPRLTGVAADFGQLFELMAQQDIQLLLASRRISLLYLTGGYYFHGYGESADGRDSQYLPLLGVPRGRLADTFWVGRTDEDGQMEVHGLWIQSRSKAEHGTATAARVAAARVRDLGLDEATIGVELAFLPADAHAVLSQELPGARLVDVTPLLRQLRSRKSPEELDVLRMAYSGLADAIQATFASAPPGTTTADLHETVRVEITRRGLTFRRAFVSAGPGVLRAPSPSQPALNKGYPVHIDAGCELGGYQADICRTACFGSPTQLLSELYDSCLKVQDRVRKQLRHGLPCAELRRAGEAAFAESEWASKGRFFAHGIGMDIHEDPLVMTDGTARLQQGHVLSIESDVIHPEVGWIKIEDAVTITESGYEALGDRGRDLRIIGQPE